MSSLSSSFLNIDNITRSIDIPSEIKSKSIDDVSIIVNDNIKKENLGKQLEKELYLLKIKPLSYVDEKKYYSYIDAAYKIYEQLCLEKNEKKEAKHSKLFAWCVANSAIYNWYFKYLFGNAMTGIEVEREVDYALRSPTIYILKNCLYAITKTLITGGVMIFGLNKSGLSNFQWHIISFYILSSIINFIKIIIRIYKKNTSPLDIIKPIT